MSRNILEVHGGPSTYHRDPYAPHNAVFQPHAQEDNLTDRAFQLRGSVRENVMELMRVMGTVEGALSLRGFARQISARHPIKKIDYKTVERWTRAIEPIEPDLVSIVVMASMAGVSFEDFALGKKVTTKDVAAGPSVETETQIPEAEQPTRDVDVVAGPRPRSRRAASSPTKRRTGGQ